MSSASASPSVEVKWGKERYVLNIDTGAPVSTFKAALEARTGVPAERQKLICKAWKGTLKEDADLSTMAIPEGTQITLMGSAEGVAKAAAPAVFVEDMRSEDKAHAGVSLPAGLVNLGNTCYMNAALECFRAVPELREGLRNVRGSGAPAAGRMDGALRDLYASLERTDKGVSPFAFVSALRGSFPQFAEIGPGGVPKQQDAEEFVSTLLTQLDSPDVMPAPSTSKYSALIDHLFGLELDVTYKC